ncbi:uncharacterized protein LOC123016210 isoform X5 [Tribolium madens]|uniref:uncharacterized protein LOC123016210 isoform X5 n=1 Tax=Tribolium madens TaxID=41895 RepID=UPI001CF750F6|nr:uncharacterized protein LOC123016210 isoform X5 [Tribolium madens]
MPPNIEQYQFKIKQLLEKLIEVKCQNRLVLDKCLNFLSEHEKREESSSVTLPIITEWINRVVSMWSATRVTPPPNIAAFTINLASLLSKNEERFCALNNNFFIKLVNIVKVRQPDCAPSIKLSYIKLLSSFLEHRSGIEWMIVCTFWEDVYQMCLRDASVEIFKQCTAFISKLLEQTFDYDETFCNNIVKRLMLPLSENIYKLVKNANDLTNSIEQIVAKDLKPSLRLIGDILENLFEGILVDNKEFRVVLVFLKHFHQDERISDFVKMAQSDCFVFEFVRISFTIQFLELYVNAVCNGISAATITDSIENIKKNFLAGIFKGTFEDVLQLCKFGYLYWNVLIRKIPNNKEEFLFWDQLFCPFVTPHYCLIIKYCVQPGTLEEEYESDTFRDAYMTKCISVMGLETIRSCYFWRDHLLELPNLFPISVLCLDYIKDVRKYLTRKDSILTFQCIYYNLEDFLWAIEKSPDQLEMFVSNPDYFSGNLELLAVLIEEHDITWKDSYEAINVLSVCFELLMLAHWPTKVVLQTLKLMNIAIAKYMSPNMALLVDNTKDSTVNLLGPLLYSKLLDILDVKLAALEVICTLGRMSRSKFPSLQKVLMDSELPTLVVKMSTCDSESFVRATAIKCLQEMIQVEEIWNNALKSEDLPQKMRDVLLNETEGIVRVEAATFMCVAYENQQFPKDNLHRLYETMIYASTTDLHWEVKVRALDFWDKVIKNHLQNQGMIDGSFPNVTFSKEHRKIVTLTDSEIRKRLLKVLSQLSSIGCLGVLMSAIKDDCDMEVSKTAAKITQRLVELFKKYNVRSDGSIPTSPLPTENGMSTASVSSGISVDESMDSPSNHHELNEDIIDQIVNSKDVCLLRNVYAPSEYSSVSNYDIQVRRVVTPNEFLQFTQQDLNTIISEKKNWLNGIEDLGSLLDDMLKTYENDVNNMDCY